MRERIGILYYRNVVVNKVQTTMMQTAAADADLAAWINERIWNANTAVQTFLPLF